MKKIFLYSALLVSGLAMAEDSPTFTFTVKDVPRDKAALEQFLVNFKANALPKIKSLHSCVTTTQILAESYRDVKEEMFGLSRAANKPIVEAPLDKPFDYLYDGNVVRNFKILKDTQSKALVAIQGFHDEMKIAPDASMDEVKAKIEKLNLRIAALSDALVSNSIKEVAFLQILNVDIEQLQKLTLDSERDIAFIASPECTDVPAQGVGLFLRRDFDEMNTNLAEMRAYVSSAREKRSKLLTYLVQYHRYKLNTRYAEIVGKDLEEIRNTMIDVLEAGKLIEEIDSYRSRNTIRGMADGLDNLYLQYEEPARLLRSRIAGAQAYIARVNAITMAPEVMKAEIRLQVQRMVGGFELSLDTLEKKGWEGQLKRQLVAVEFLEKSDKPYRDDCRASITAWRQLNVTTIETFRTAEDIFFEIRELCTTDRLKA